MRVRSPILTAVAVSAIWLSGCGGDEPGPATERAPSTGASPTGQSSPRSPGPGSGDSDGGARASPEAAHRPNGTTDPEKGAPASNPEPHPVSVLGLAAQRHRGDQLRLGAVREQTAAYTSYDMSYRSRTTTRRGVEAYTISGVVNVPRGRGPFPAVVLAHGYIDPEIYVRGQGMTRERGYLAARGYIAMHVDYRNHAESEEDPLAQVRMRLGYSADVINAVKALRASRNVPVDPDRLALFGRSMGGGVVMKALIAEPGLVQAASLWASVSSLEPENYQRFIRPDPEGEVLRDRLARRWGTPEESPQFWRENSSRPYLDRLTEPVLIVHGRFDETCPPRWAIATQRALGRAGVTSTLAWYADGHAFGPAFAPAMERTVRFFDRRLRTT